MRSATRTSCVTLGALVLGGLACNAILGTEEPIDAPADAASDVILADKGDAAPNDARAEASSCAGDLSKNPEHCGRCGHSCLGGECAANACEPRSLAGGLKSPVDITERGTFIYWVEQGTASNVGKDGRIARSPKAICDGGCSVGLADADSPSGLAVNGNDVFATRVSAGASSSVLRLPLNGSTTSTFATGQTFARRIVLETDSAIWIDSGSGPNAGVVRRKDFATDGGTGVSILKGENFPVAIAIAGTEIFVANGGQLDTDGSIIRADIDGKNRTVLVPTAYQPRGLAVDGTFVYWANRSNGTIGRVRRDGSVKGTEIVTNCNSPVAVAIDGLRVYWAEQGTAPDYLDGRIRAADLDGKNVLVLATGLPSPSDLVVDDRALYFSVRGTLDQGYRDGAVYLLAKP